jgi:hypothetical protein
VIRACGQTPLRRPRDDDDQDRGPRRSSSRGFLSRLLGCMDTRGRGRGREHQCDSNRRTEGYRGQPSHYRVGTIYDEVPATHWTFEEQRTLRQLWQAKGQHHLDDLPTNDIFSDPVVYETSSTDRQFRSEAIVITPIAREFFKKNQLGHENQRTTNLPSVGNTLTGNSSAVTPKIAGPANMEVQNIR